ncbi:prepilin-type N-terminal cleavage/methylation domain-containing protein [Photobacterium toruni]|uniref:Prepilin-type N-terminal cleavage/methylation domain-containing protein n=1 Tax=Photobacterium toruni TaxID=1935446 RepID=A0ABU6L828_9GAMM|nr:prepilin-type N-terminal cleavage/methylation domain-containing protein [Photobacterium toruni]
MISNIKKITGFSLLEVVIALGILSVGVLGLVKMQAYMELKAENALKTLDALHIAEAQMEYYQTRVSNVSGATGLISFDELDELEPSSASGTVRKLKHCMDPEFTDGTIFELDCTVSKGVDTLSDALRTINVSVSWADRRGVSQAVSLKTAISKYSEFD